MDMLPILPFLTAPMSSVFLAKAAFMRLTLTGRSYGKRMRGMAQIHLGGVLRPVRSSTNPS